MADGSTPPSLLADDPRGRVLDRIEAAQASAAPAQSPRAAVEALSRETGAPINMLLAAMEAGGAQTGEDGVRIAHAVAPDMGARFKAGEHPENIAEGLFGGDREAAIAFMGRADALGQQYYPELAAKSPNLVGDLGRQTASGGVTGLGSMAEGAATLGAAAFTPAGSGLEKGAMAVGRAAREAAQKGADYFDAGMSWRDREAMRGFAPDGVGYDPRTWTLGPNPTLRGAALWAMNVFGSMLPVVASAVLSGGGSVGASAAGAIAGGLQGAGEGSATGDEIVRAAARDGTLEAASPEFRALLAEGMDYNEAVDRLAARTAQLGAVFQAPISMFGGAVTSKIIHGAAGRAIGGGVMRRALGSSPARATRMTSRTKSRPRS